MKYFKILVNDKVIGAISSDDFIFRRRSGGFGNTNEQYAQLAIYKDGFYRASWMLPMDYEFIYTEASILSISEEEYNAFKHAEESDQEIENNIEEEQEEEQPIWVNPVEQETIEYLREAKLREMSYICRTTIEAGFDLELRGEAHHFSLDTQDQLNLISLSAMAQTQSMIPYHADGESCIFYSAEEINEIVATATSFKIYHTTYYNALKAYINSLDTIEAISAITYGIEIPEEYKTDVLRFLEG